ncbi:GAF domain-containing sensor histidine kinase [Roseofilum casamattae]|uniref:histidine kinase n=1 Tax=Roseofilum casamattae BLCC-M143 TaxID=3022442 RepID=A0ABT7BRC0_9CYAN|nr:GAF domain-containing protein [Roseofilum casamattae]MDJ1181721.1 GAF domain-containing protein [Roseofilum casamattae BLCC-M143]
MSAPQSPQSPQSPKSFNSLQQTAYQLASCTDRLFEEIEQQQALAKILDNIRSSFDVRTIFKTTAREIRHLLNADRVALFQFAPDSGYNTGEFVWEDISPEWPSALGFQVDDRWFGSQFVADYIEGKIQTVTNIYETELSNFQLEFLQQFQIKAYLIVPVIQENKLWGLLDIHQCSQPRRWKLNEIDFIRKIANYFAIALQQAGEREQAINRQKSLVKIVGKIQQSFDWSEICQTTTEEVRLLLNVDRAAVFRFNPDWSGDFVFESVASGWNPLVGVSPVIEDTYLMETQGGRYADRESFAVADIYTVGHSDCHIELLEQFQAKAYAIAPIFQGKKLWGLLAVFQNSRSRQWKEDEVELLVQLGDQLAIALQQAEFVAQIQAQSTQLEQMLAEVQQSQLQLVQHEKMASLGQLVAGIAHEINNPVNFIYGNLSHVQTYTNDLLNIGNFYQDYESKSAEEIAEFQEDLEEMELEFIVEDLPKTLASMKLGADRIRDLVLSLRNFSRLDEAEVKAVDLHEGINSTLLILGHRIKSVKEKAAIEIIKDYGNIPCLNCYPAQLNQVFMNLLANALDSLEEKSDRDLFAQDTNPQICIRTRSSDDGAIAITISDNGMGIEEEALSRIFDRFFTTKSLGKGTGLGLALCQDIIIEQHGGTINARSTVGEGAEFEITLPIHQ